MISMSESNTPQMTEDQKRQIQAIVTAAVVAIFASKTLDERGAAEVIKKSDRLQVIITGAINELSKTVFAGKDKHIVEILLDVGLVKLTDVQEAQKLVETDKNLGTLDALIQMKIVTREDAIKAYATQFGMDFVKISDCNVADEVIAMVPAAVARRYKIIPLFKHEGKLTIALCDPLDVDTIDSLRYVLKVNIEALVALEEEIETALIRYYGVAS